MALRTDYEYEARVLKVIDADTLRCEIILADYGFGILDTVTKDIRVQGIDVWEIRHRDQDHRARGEAARSRVLQLCPPPSKIRVRTMLVEGRIGSDRDDKEKMTFTRVEGDVFVRITSELSEAGWVHNYTCPGSELTKGRGWCRLADVLRKEGHEKVLGR